MQAREVHLRAPHVLPSDVHNYEAQHMPVVSLLGVCQQRVNLSRRLAPCENSEIALRSIVPPRMHQWLSSSPCEEVSE